MLSSKYYFEFAKKSCGYDNPTSEIKNNVDNLLNKVNQFLSKVAELENITIEYVATSTIRTEKRNAETDGAKKSLHLIGRAIDIKDTNGKLANAILNHLDLLKQYKLCFEDPNYTKGWVHLDDRARGGEFRMFKP